MSVPIPENFVDLFSRRAFAHLATVMPDGSPQVTPVWIDFDGTHIQVNSAKGRVKDRNMRANPKVALSIVDPENPYRYIQVRGRVSRISESGADEHIDKLARKYLNVASYPHRTPGEVRVIYHITPERVNTMG